MSDNLRNWDALGKTDPRQTKPFQRAGGFRGTATKPIWIEYRLTQHFGPCGIGWGMEKPEFDLVPAGDELLIFCVLKCWYVDNGTRAEVYGIGGDKVMVKRQSGTFSDDEAFKKAFTDALGNAFKHVGSGADVHMGLFEDSKYVAETKHEFEQEDREQSPTPKPANTQQSRSDHPRRPEAIAAYKRIIAGLENAPTPKLIDEIVAANTADLALIKEVNAPTYDSIISLASARKTELRAAA